MFYIMEYTLSILFRVFFRPRNMAQDVFGLKKDFVRKVPISGQQRNGNSPRTHLENVSATEVHFSIYAA